MRGGGGHLNDLELYQTLGRSYLVARPRVAFILSTKLGLFGLCLWGVGVGRPKPSATSVLNAGGPSGGGKLLPVPFSAVVEMEPEGETFVKTGVTPHEHEMHLHAHASGIPVPTIKTCALKMEMLPGMNLADWYGEDDVPESAFERVRALVRRMVEAGIDFPDLTGYNFMATYQDNEVDRLWVVDFEHARRVPGEAQCCDFVRDFLAGHNGWNPAFR